MRSIGDALQLAEVVTAMGLLAAMPLCLALAYRDAWRFWRADGAPAGAARLLLVAVAAAAVLRWLVAPLEIATVFIGYRWTRQALDLFPVSHYGAGAQAFGHVLLSALPADHRTLMAANSVIGVLTIPLVATVGARLLLSRWTGAVAALLLALLPLAIRNDTSDANNVPMLWWLFGGLTLWTAWLRTGRAMAGALAVPLLALAAVARPETLALVPLAVAASWLMVPPRDRPRVPRLVWLPLALGAVALVPHALFIGQAALGLAEGDSLPVTQHFSLWALVPKGRQLGVVFLPHLYPAGLTLLALFAVVRAWRTRRSAPTGEAPETPARPPARAVLWLALLALAFFVVYMVDLDAANIARAHTPGAVLVTLLAAAGLLGALAWLRGTWGRVALVGVAVASAVPTAVTLFQPTNEATEEALIRDAVAALPDEPYVLIHPSFQDQQHFWDPMTFTHHYLPDYLFGPPGGEGEIMGIREAVRKDVASGARPVYFLHGMRCHARRRSPDEPTPAGDHLQPFCRFAHEAFRLEPVFERVVPNHGDVWIPYYGDAPTLRLGLYRVVGVGERGSAR